jgi:hypothetical protein
MTKVTTSKGLIEEYNSISSKSESFGKWVIKKNTKYRYHDLGEDWYSIGKLEAPFFTMKQLFEMYEYETHKHLIHK